MKYAFRSELSIEECRKRFEQNVDTGLIPNNPFNKKEFYGRINEKSKFTLAKKTWYRSDFKPIFFGKIEKDAAGKTAISGEFIFRLISFPKKHVENILAFIRQVFEASEF